MTAYPQIIQGGMGPAVSNWHLARAVSQLGQLGVVSGTALAVILARRLQVGDLGGQMRQALAHFPMPAVAARIVADHFVPGGKRASTPFSSVPFPSLRPAKRLVELTVAANFVEVFLAKRGHAGVVGINLLEKIQFPTLPSLYGAMLAGVDYVLMGAGIPRTIPGVLDRFARGEAADLKIDVGNTGQGEEYLSVFDPAAFCDGEPPSLKRPRFLGIVASAALAAILAKKSNGRVDGFVIEGETAGGHNAPPRGSKQLSEAGEPVYGSRDVPDLEAIHALGLPFWLAGSYGKPGKLAEAQALGAVGVQAGTAFASCDESGITAELKHQVIALSRAGKARVFTDPVASPTGFPFKVVQVEGTLSEASVYEARPRICDQGYLRQAYRTADGGLGYRCPAEPVADYVRKGGLVADTVGRKCVCNGLLAAVGLSQGGEGVIAEPVLLTGGDDVAQVAQFAEPGCDSYTAGQVLAKLLGSREPRD